MQSQIESEGFDWRSASYDRTAPPFPQRDPAGLIEILGIVIWSCWRGRRVISSVALLLAREKESHETGESGFKPELVSLHGTGT